jgi:hypothetical protein
MARVWYYQARAFIAYTFHTYTFEALDALPSNKIFELYAAAQWIHDQLKKANQPPPGGRRK